MTILSIKDFTKGDAVFHRSNSHLKMIVIGTIEDTGEVTCRWTDADGKTHKEEFFSQELDKCADLGASSFRILNTRNKWRY